MTDYPLSDEEREAMEAAWIFYTHSAPSTLLAVLKPVEHFKAGWKAARALYHPDTPSDEEVERLREALSRISSGRIGEATYRGTEAEKLDAIRGIARAALATRGVDGPRD